MSALWFEAMRVHMAHFPGQPHFSFHQVYHTTPTWQVLAKQAEVVPLVATFEDFLLFDQFSKYVMWRITHET